jgi:hypothetical protein
MGTMSLTETRILVGTDRLWLAPGGTEKVLVGVMVVDVRMSFGRPQLHVIPLSGRGARWVDVDSTQDAED